MAKLCDNHVDVFKAANIMWKRKSLWLCHLIDMFYQNAKKEPVCYLIIYTIDCKIKPGAKRIHTSTWL